MTDAENMNESIVPAQKKGAKSDTSYSVHSSSEDDARDLFQSARFNLLNVNCWHSLVGSGADFQLTNEKGEKIEGPASKGNYFRIQIPGVPHSDAGNGDEWVYVEKIEEGKLKYHEFTAIRVRPAVPPFIDKNETAHFFSDDATSSFCVVRNSDRVTVSIIGRNEKPNTDTSDPLRWIRNVVVAIGAMIGLNKPQWKKLAKAIVKKRRAVPEAAEIL